MGIVQLPFLSVLACNTLPNFFSLIRISVLSLINYIVYDRVGAEYYRYIVIAFLLASADKFNAEAD
jgi:hypothetical protein